MAAGLHSKMPVIKNKAFLVTQKRLTSFNTGPAIRGKFAQNNKIRKVDFLFCLIYKTLFCLADSSVKCNNKFMCYLCPVLV